MALSSSKEALVVGWIIAVGLCSGCAARNPTPLDLRDKLWKDASEVFERRGVVLTDEGREPLQALIASGSATLEEKGASAQEIKAAEDAIRAFAEDIVVQANRNGCPVFGSTILS